MASDTAINLQSELAAIVGEGNVVMPTSGEFEIEGVIPAHVVSPASAEEVAAVMRLANESGAVVVPAGGMTKQHIGNTPERIDILLRTTRLNEVHHYDPGDLTVGVGAGMAVTGLQSVLTANQQFLPLDVAQEEIATIGGVLATNAQGPLRSGFGGVRDYCIGIEFVTAEGKIAKGGGRVVKNVAGYDLMKLMIGSYGTLGLVTSANFKVFPKPRQTRTFECRFASPGEAMRFRDKVMRSALTPMCMEVASPRAQEYFADAHAARNPDQYVPHGQIEKSSGWKIFVRATGSDTVLERYRKELGSAVGAEFDGEKESQLWGWVSNFEVSVAARHRNAMVMYVSCPISSAGAALVAAERASLEQNCMCATVGRVTVGVLVVAMMPLSVDPPTAMQYANAASALRASLPADASAVVARCPKEAKPHFNVWGTSPTDLKVMMAVREAMDGKGILNRGRFVV